MSAFMERVNRWSGNLPVRQRAMIIAGIGAILMMAIYWLALLPKQPVTSSGPTVAKPVQTKVRPAITTGYTAQTMRDPFSPPPSFDKQYKPPVASLSAYQQQIPAAPDAVPAAFHDIPQQSAPLLIGVVAGGERQMAIIRYNGSSRSYYPGQDVGPYKLVSIDDRSVIIRGSGGQQVLTLGR